MTGGKSRPYQSPKKVKIIKKNCNPTEMYTDIPGTDNLYMSLKILTIAYPKRCSWSNIIEIIFRNIMIDPSTVQHPETPMFSFSLFSLFFFFFWGGGGGGGL